MIKQYLPGLNPEVVREEPCLYTNTPDSHFIIDQLPGYQNAVVAGGFSGHGFKFAPVVGNMIRQIVLDGTVSDSQKLFSFSRFQKEE